MSSNKGRVVISGSLSALYQVTFRDLIAIGWSRTGGLTGNGFGGAVAIVSSSSSVRSLLELLPSDTATIETAAGGGAFRGGAASTRGFAAFASPLPPLGCFAGLAALLPPCCLRGSAGFALGLAAQTAGCAEAPHLRRGCSRSAANCVGEFDVA